MNWNKYLNILLMGNFQKINQNLSIIQHGVDSTNHTLILNEIR
jgi:hypothetical protein